MITILKKFIVKALLAVFVFLHPASSLSGITVSISPISDELKTQTGAEKSLTKSTEIAKIHSIAKVRRTSQYFDGYLQIVSITATTTPLGTGMVQVLARAWDSNNQQIGFGPDGSVDVEMFQIVNPPVLVPDPNGKVVRSWTDEVSGEQETRTYREDLTEALLQSLDHTIKVKKQKFSDKNIVFGRIGHTTTTVYPDADTETTSVDGEIRNLEDPINSSWATIHDASAGSSANSNGGTIRVNLSIGSVQALPFEDLWRIITLFDSSPTPDTEIISAVTYSLYLSSKAKSISASYDLRVVTSTPASNTDVVTGDFDQLGTVAQATDKTYAGLTASAYNDWAFNATGIGNVSKTGVSPFGARLATDADNTEPTWESGNPNQQLNFASADTAGTTSDPKLVIESSTPVTYKSGLKVIIIQ